MSLTIISPLYGKIIITNTNIDESVLTRKHYKLADFSTESGQAYAININNHFAYPIIGKRFDIEMKKKHPSFSDIRCCDYIKLGVCDLKL